MNNKSAPVFALILLLAAFTARAAGPGQAGVATAHPLATDAGIEILKKGGNAFDAAVAVSAALAVVEPYASGLGGGGFWLLHRVSDQKQVMIDGRETAPAAAHRDMYLDAGGNPVRERSLNGPLAAGIPGTPAALDHLARHYGKLSLQASLAPAIRLAKHGFDVSRHYRKLAAYRQDVMRRWAYGSGIFLDNGQVPEVGQRIVQPDLAAVLTRLAEHGRDGFYRGPVAERLVSGVREHGGIWSLDDLGDYHIIERSLP